MSVTVADDRASHWVRVNHQNRVPKRWIAFDCEAKSDIVDDTETQTWRMGAAIRWRTDLKTGDHAEAKTFESALEFWQWVTEFCKPGVRTCASAHNLGYDARVTQALEILPKLGWRLEWCNLDRNVSAMTWRGDHGTLVLWDTWTWIPLPLATVAPTLGMRKLAMPTDNAKHYKWEKYCMRDAEIVYHVVADLVEYIKSQNLGNWQPTGAGMAYATWRHRFMAHKILVHDDVDALTAERKAMHCGRAEAWKHGELEGQVWTELDMRNAYVTIAAECNLPTKLKFSTGRISVAQYRTLCRSYRVLVVCEVHTTVPCVPYHDGTRTMWPVGNFHTVLWDTEANLAIQEGAQLRILKAYTYTMSPILREWAVWVLSILRDNQETTSPVVKTWLKHCSRALIGRIALRSTRWEYFGANPFGMTCMTHVVDSVNGRSHRLMHIGDRTFEETGRVEGRDSLPQVTGWIMAECRTRLWHAMRVAGLDQLAHVDTDSFVTSRAGVRALREAYSDASAHVWSVKGSARRVVVYGPRNYRWGKARKVAGVPRKAREILPNVFTGERWQGLSQALEDGQSGAVQIVRTKWELNVNDPRRLSSTGVATRAVEIYAAAGSSTSALSSSRSGVGA